MPKLFEIGLVFALILSSVFSCEVCSAQVQTPFESFQRKTYLIKNIPVDEARKRLQQLMPDEIRSKTLLLVDPKANELFVQGPPAAVEMADNFLPRMQQINIEPAHGTLSPIVSRYQLGPQNQSNIRQAGARSQDSSSSRIQLVNGENPEEPIIYGNPAGKLDAPPPSGKIYRCAVGNVEAFADELNRRFGEDPTVCFTFTDDTASRIVNVSVIAPENILAQFGSILRQMGVLLPDSAETQAAKIDEDVETETAEDFLQKKTVFIPQKSITKLEQLMQSALGSRLVRKKPDSQTTPNERASGAVEYEISILRNNKPKNVALIFDYDRRRISIDGDKKICEQLVLLLHAIDKPDPTNGFERKIIQIHKKNAKILKKAAELYATVLPRNYFRPQTSPAALAVPQARYAGVTDSQPVRQVVYKRQQDGFSIPDGLDPGIGGELPPMMPGAEGMYGNGVPNTGIEVPQSLNILPLTDLDIILFEGTKSEFERFKNMIQDIEKLMLQSQSKFEVVMLKHTDCISMNEMIADMLLKLSFLTKRGKVDLIPLRNPNAIMLIGWGTAMDDMRELIKALDQPISEPGSRWKAIQLRYVSATYAAQIVRDMFPLVPNVPAVPPGYPPPIGYGWMPRIKIVADIRTNSLIIEAGPNDMREVEQFVRKLDIYKSGPTLKVVEFKIRYSLASDVAAVLTSILSPGAAQIGATGDRKFPEFSVEKLTEGEARILKSGIVTDFTITPDYQHNVLFVSAPEYAVELIAELIRKIDVPSSSAHIKMIQVFNGDANQIVDNLKAIFPTQMGGQMAAQLPGSETEDKFVPLRFGVDVRTNTIIAVGAEKDLEAVQAMVFRLDSEEKNSRMYEIYPLRNAQADKIAAAIRRYTLEQRQLTIQTPGAKSVYLQAEEAFIVVPEIETNSLIIEATSKYMDKLKELIKKLDRSPDQVMIQVLIAEVTCSNADEFGAEFGLQDSILFDRSSFERTTTGTRTVESISPDGTRTTISEPIYSVGGDAIPGFTFGNANNPLGNNVNVRSEGTLNTVAPQLLTSFDTRRVNSETGFGGMVFSASSDSVSILIRALREAKRLEILSRPQIVAMDNQNAFILVGQRVPFAGGGSIGQSGVYSSNVTMEEVGLMLMVTPRISPDGKIIMEIGAEKSSVGSMADAIPIPDGSGGSVPSPKINAITTRTIISASDNETVLLGGLLTKETQNINRRVPFLSDIPILGRLFQYKADTVRKTELIIILTPRVVRHSETQSADAERIKREEAARISWCLHDVVKIHGDDIGIWDPTAEKPVTGGVIPVYPEMTPLDELRAIE